MNILLTFLLVFIIAFVTVFYYERKIRNLSLKLKNNVHFYVARDKYGDIYLYLSKPVRSGSCFYPDFCGGLIASEPNFKNFDLKVENFKDITWDDGPVEVFLKLNS